MNGIVTILGGTGFVGRALVERWPQDDRSRLRLLWHRARPDWLASSGADVRAVDLGDADSLEQAFAGSSVVINLLRPNGDGYFADTVARLIRILAATDIRRYVHCSSVDVYGNARQSWITEETPASPQTSYEREHLAAEQTVASSELNAAIVRFGPIFGEGGRNLVAMANEIKNAPLWKLAARRALYGKRRKHLVSVEKAADAIRFLATTEEPHARGVFLVTDDDAPENNFAFVQDAFASALSRPSLRSVPALPTVCLRLALRLRGRSQTDPLRRFSGKRLAELGFRSVDEFRPRLEHYVASRAKTRWDTTA